MAGLPVATRISSVVWAPLNQYLLSRASGSFTSMSVRGFGKQSRAKREAKQNRPRLAHTKKIQFEPSLAIQRNDGQWYLPAGTRVKHGTTTNNLRSIIECGIMAGNQAEGRSKSRCNPEVQDGIYVASCYLAYSASTFNFLASANEHHSKLLSSDFDSPRTASTREEKQKLRQDLARKLLVDVDDMTLKNCGLPSVLNIVLQEDVIIRADEDFLDKTREAEARILSHAAGFVWEQFGSCVLMVDKVPTNWIESVELVETDYRDEAWELLLYLTSDSPILELTRSIVKKKLMDSERKFDENKMNSKMRMKQDTKNIQLARSLFSRYQVEARKLWHEGVTQQKQGKNVFSHVLPAENVNGFLDELEKDQRRFLATYFSLVNQVLAR
jgi:hypothetical protein